MVITIDGPAGSGKSTIAREAAGRLGAVFLDTGAMYRAVTFAAIQEGVDLENEDAIMIVVRAKTFTFTAGDSKLDVQINGQDVCEAIRSHEVTGRVKHIAGSASVREVLVRWQREFAKQYQKVVTEGRDQGTVVFPNADRKFFLTADIEERARRRKQELAENGKELSLQALVEAIQMRDESDRSRKVGPLRKADDAIEIDTTGMTIEQVVESVVSQIQGANDG